MQGAPFPADFVLGVDLSEFFAEHSGFLTCDLPDGRRHRGAAHVIAVVNAPEMKYALYLLGRGFLRDKFVTGSPLFDDNLRFLQVVEDFAVQQLIA